ncbi:MAG TPA: flagella basal body P-ring formation protein FlgA [Verrucomicrobiae bacterium]|nr:flagella basal body P-ring formation protein FlgA [Verrucomicrobiae bacterium]
MRSLCILGLSTIFAVGSAFAAPVEHVSRVSLLEQVEVRGNSIFLSDLLPSQVPAVMRTSAQGILIGIAPQPGSTRVLDGDKLAGMIGAANGVDEIDIPKEIVVRRAGCKITREEVIAVIRAALIHSGLPDADLRPDDLRVFPSVMVSSADTSLQVRRVDFDDTLNQAKFLMAERGSVPFLVTAQFRDTNLMRAATQESTPAPVAAPASAALPAAVAANVDVAVPAVPAARPMLRLASGSLVSASQFAGPPLVEPGKAAVLFLNSGTMRMLLDVTALERGSLNQTVRVRLPGTGKILHAQVTGERRLVASF